MLLFRFISAMTERGCGTWGYLGVGLRLWSRFGLGLELGRGLGAEIGLGVRLTRGYGAVDA